MVSQLVSICDTQEISVCVAHDSGLRSIRAGLAILAAACFVSFGNAQPTPTSGGGNPSSGNGNNPSDPGPRGDPPAAGGPVAGLGGLSTLYAAFNAGAATFQEVDDVTHSGLGPRFNSDSCVSCHRATCRRRQQSSH